MAKLPPKKITQSTDIRLAQNLLPSAKVGGFAGNVQHAEWIELLDPCQPYYGNRCVEGMYRMLFDNPSLYQAYYAPRQMPGVTPAAATPDPGSVCTTLLMVKPMQMVLRSAYQAAHSGLVKPHERPLVHLAAIVSPCGLLMATHDADDEQTPATASWDKIAFLRMYMLSKPLIKIKAFNVEMGNTLSAVLGQTYEQEDVDFDQVTRLATAVRLSDTKLASHWVGQITTTPWSAV